MLWLALVFLKLAFAAQADFESAPWRALLHFQGSKSSIEASSPFFLSPEGHRNPQAEGISTLEILKTEEGRCRFPARALFFGYAPEGKGELCDRWKKWREAIRAEGVDIVFASAFLNSPSSMYGHTLLKFRRRNTNGNELLDYALSYGAETGSSAGAAYIWKGLTGGFLGRHATSPFYLKIKEYDHVEHRDFWTYPVKLSPAEVELLVAHAWELREVNFPYYFLRENCSFYLLEFLQVARPLDRLTDGFPFWVIPVDTMRRLNDRGLLLEGRYRPSRQRVLKETKSSLESESLKRISDLADGSKIDSPSDLEVRTAMDLALYRKGKISEHLLALAQSRSLSADRETVSGQDPLYSHKTASWFLGAGKGEGQTFGSILVRPALHDFLQPSFGYEPNSTLSMGALEGRWQGDKVFVENFDLLRIRSIAPYEKWFPNKSWNFSVGAAREKRRDCLDWRCLQGRIEGGAGLSFSLPLFRLFMMGQLRSGAGGVGFQGAGGLSSGLVGEWKDLRLVLEGQKLWSLWGKGGTWEAKGGLGWSPLKDWELRLEALAAPSSFEEGRVLLGKTW